MIDRPQSISTMIIFIYLNALIWLVFGLIIAFNAHPSLPDMPLLKAGMTFLSFVLGALFLVLGFYLHNRNRLSIFLTVGILLGTAFFSFFDQFGWIDLIFLVINILPILLLIKDRAWYLQNRSASPMGK
jgi:lysylphosphatidylglycerol synthetase-like protein (DUF2156 family)